MRLLRAIGPTALALLLASAGSATTITLSDASSDATDASTLDATLAFSVIGGDTLQLVLTNDTTAPDAFNINQVFWNASDDVTGLTLTSASHSVNGDVFAAWSPVELNTMVNGFGVFEFGLTDGQGETHPSVAQPGISITFLMDITGTCADSFSCDMDDFFAANSMGYVGAAKFVSGPDDPESPGNEDSAFGAAVVPEPGTGALLGFGLLLLARRRTR